MFIFWFYISILGFYKIVEVFGGFCEEIGFMGMYLYRWYVNFEFLEGGSFERCFFDDLFVGKFGVYCE